MPEPGTGCTDCTPDGSDRAAAGCLIGFVLEFFLFGADYTRTEYLEYDDDDYYYYVKAVPKFNVTKAQRRVTYIRNEKKKEPDLTDEELDALANLGHTEESGNSRDLDENRGKKRNRRNKRKQKK